MPVPSKNRLLTGLPPVALACRMTKQGTCCPCFQDDATNQRPACNHTGRSLTSRLYEGRSVGGSLFQAIGSPAAVHFGTTLPPLRSVAGVVPFRLLDFTNQLRLAQFADPGQPHGGRSLANLLYVHCFTSRRFLQSMIGIFLTSQTYGKHLSRPACKMSGQSHGRENPATIYY